MIGIHLFLRNLPLCSLLLFFTTSTQAEIYRSIDKNGRPFYSDEPHAASELYQPDTPIQPIPKPQLPTIKPSKKAQTKKNPQKNNAHKKRAKLKKRCDYLAEKIKTVNVKLRQGHTNDQGNRLRKQRRKYSDQHWRECRK